METSSRSVQQVALWALLGVAIIAAFGVGSFFQSGFTWGAIAVRQAPSVTVSGYATQDEQNQIAYYSAGVTATNMEKDAAVGEVNTSVNEIIALLEDFGIEKADIQTQNLSIYKMERSPFDEVSSIRPTEYPSGPVNDEYWQANNSLEITLRDVSRASELADLLASTGATNVYGPRFSLDDRERTEDALIQAAIENAREKAEKIAESSGRRLGKIEYVVEGTGNSEYYPMFARAESSVGYGGADAAVVEPGTTQVSKSVTVTFSLR